MTQFGFMWTPFALFIRLSFLLLSRRSANPMWSNLIVRDFHFFIPNKLQPPPGARNELTKRICVNGTQIKIYLIVLNKKFCKEGERFFFLNKISATVAFFLKFNWQHGRDLKRDRKGSVFLKRPPIKYAVVLSGRVCCLFVLAHKRWSFYFLMRPKATNSVRCCLIRIF